MTVVHQLDRAASLPSSAAGLGKMRLLFGDEFLLTHTHTHTNATDTHVQ